MLTGEWGSGKSFLVKEIAKELNSSKTAAIAVISLFGINTIADLNRRVKEEYTLLFFGQSGRNTAKYLKAATKVVKEGFNVAETATSNDVVISAASKGISSILSFDILSFIEIQNTIGSKEHKRHFVLVFDDLERCGIPDQKDILDCFDDQLLNSFISVFFSSPNGKKRELALTLLKICFTDPNYSSEDDVNTTRNSFCILKNQLKNSNEKDQISELIIKSFILGIDNLSIFNEQ